MVESLCFKIPELEKEFDKRGWIDPRLRAITYYLAFYVFKEFSKNWIITQEYRTPEEQIKIYPDYYEKYKHPKPSPHCVIPVRAIDIRSKALTLEEIEELKKQFFKWFGNEKIDSTAFKHHFGTAWHIHYHVNDLIHF